MLQIITDESSHDTSIKYILITGNIPLPCSTNILILSRSVLPSSNTLEFGTVCQLNGEFQTLLLKHSKKGPKKFLFNMQLHLRHCLIANLRFINVLSDNNNNNNRQNFTKLADSSDPLALMSELVAISALACSCRSARRFFIALFTS